MTLHKLVLPGVIGLATMTGLGVGSLIDNAASAATTTAATSTTQSPTSGSGSSTGKPAQGQPPPGPMQDDHTANGITETELTGDTYTKAVAAAKAAEPNATVVRAETDADGAKYEVHMQKSDDSMVTVKLDDSFNVTSTENGM